MFHLIYNELYLQLQQKEAQKERDINNLLLTTTIFVDGNMPNSAYMLFSVSFTISEQRRKR